MASSPSPPPAKPESGLKWRALAWLAFLGPWFFLAYGFCNWFTAQRGNAGQLWWDWERLIPFVPAFIVPYMSLDLFYAGAPFICKSRQELRLLGTRLFTVTTLSCLCFLAFPLEYGWPRPVPPPDSWTAPVFRFLHAGDLPYNMAPSLHISLRSIIWVTYGQHLRGTLRSVTKLWFFLIGCSTLLVGQHHFIDVVTGFLMAYAVMALLPDRSQPFVKRLPCAKSRTLRNRYAFAAALLAVTALQGGGFLWLLWPACALGIIATAYATGDSRWWQKSHGALTPAVEWIMLPFILPAKLWQVRWRRGAPRWHEVTPGVFFGRRPGPRDRREFTARGIGAVLDLTPESTQEPFVREGCVRHHLPVLDLLTPPPAVLTQAVAFIEANAARRVLIHCELGLSRSACTAAAWLLAARPALTVEEAMREISRLEPRAVLKRHHAETLRAWRDESHDSSA